MHHWGKGTSHCPRCDQIQEDRLHIIVCTASRAKAVWELSLQALSQWMLNNKTLPQLRTYIIQALRCCKNDQNAPPLPTYNKFSLHHAITTQTWIGWKNFLDGFISIEWRQVQDKYYAWLAICRTDRRWVTALLEKLLDVLWTMWDNRNDTLYTAITPWTWTELLMSSVKIASSSISRWILYSLALFPKSINGLTPFSWPRQLFFTNMNGSRLPGRLIVKPK
jgi:hypothetical protein